MLVLLGWRKTRTNSRRILQWKSEIRPPSTTLTKSLIKLLTKANIDIQTIAFNDFLLRVRKTKQLTRSSVGFGSTSRFVLSVLYMFEGFGTDIQKETMPFHGDIFLFSHGSNTRPGQHVTCVNGFLVFVDRDTSVWPHPSCFDIILRIHTHTCKCESTTAVNCFG